MASTYNQKKEEEALRLKQQQGQTAGNAALGGAQQQAASLADATQQQANTGYMPSAQLQQAQQYAQQVQQQKPGAYQSAITPQLQAQFEAIMNRQPFQYDLGTDAMFQQMSDMYVQQGRRAMQDAIGEATALTGGYGNSYAQGAGQAAYGNYLQQLGAQAPQFQQNAFARWQSEGADMMDRYNMAAAREESDYARYQDALSNYWAEADRAQQAADNLYNREYGEYIDRQNHDFQQQQFAQELKEYEQSVSSENRDYAYNLALMMLQGGQMPSADVLATAGISQTDAASILAMYTPKAKSGGSGGSGSGGSSGSKKAATTDQVKKNIDNYVNLQTWSEEDVLSRPEWEAKRDEADPFYAAQKATTLATLPLTQRVTTLATLPPLTEGINTPDRAIEDASKNSTEEYKGYYVENEIERMLDEGIITPKQARDLAYRYL